MRETGKTASARLRCYGVIGFPIDHSLSPAMHQAAYRALGLAAQYGAYAIPPGDLKRGMRALAEAGLRGFNVTVPHKERAARLVDSLDPTAAALGAVNTVIVRGGRLHGANTDVAGFRRALEGLGWKPPRQKRAALVLGAGGAAKAVVWELARQGLEITIANRTLARARALRRWIVAQRPKTRIAVAPFDAIPESDYALIVNTTSVGMQARGDRLPLPKGFFAARPVVYDLVYNRRTRLVSQALQSGCVAAGGEGMLLYQGAEAFRLWFRKQAPVEAMRRALLGALNRPHSKE